MYMYPHIRMQLSFTSFSVKYMKVQDSVAQKSIWSLFLGNTQNTLNISTVYKYHSLMCSHYISGIAYYSFGDLVPKSFLMCMCMCMFPDVYSIHRKHFKPFNVEAECCT